MNPDQMPPMTPAKEENKEQELVAEVNEAPLEEVIDAVLWLPAKDLQTIYEAIWKVIKSKKKEASKTEEMPEAGPESEFDAQEMARSFM